MTTLHLNSSNKSCLVFVCIAAFLSSCVSPNAALPNRTVDIVIYSDKTCNYSFNKLGFGTRENQEWYLLESPDGEQFIHCKNKNVKYGAEQAEPPEVWTGVGILLRKQFSDTQYAKTPEGHYLMQPVKYRDPGKYQFEPAEYPSKGLAWPATVLVDKGTAQNNKRLPLSPVEVFPPCGTSFSSTDNSRNRAIEYSKEHRSKTGILMEIESEVKAVSAAC